MTETEHIICDACKFEFDDPKVPFHVCLNCGAWICGRCRWTWYPKVDRPKYCPACKRPLMATTHQIKQRAQRRIEQARKLRAEREELMTKIDVAPSLEDEEFLCKTCFNVGNQKPAIVKIGKSYYCKEHAYDAFDEFLEGLEVE